MSEENAEDGRQFGVSGSPVLDRSRIDMIRSLDKKGDSLLGRLVEVFADEAEKTMAALRSADEQGDRMALHRTAHRLHGSASNIGVPALAAVCAELEIATAPASLADHALSPLVVEIEHALDRALEALRSETGRVA